MNTTTHNTAPDPAQAAIWQLRQAISRAIKAAQEIEHARDNLDRVLERRSALCVVGGEDNSHGE